MNKKEKKFFYIEYTTLFLLIASIAVFFFYSQGKSMIGADSDGFRQHYRALLYYSKVLKELFLNPFSIPQWDFVIGEGSDILRTFHYYCVGDIFTFFSFLCPEKYMYIYYDFATLARMYFSGIAFSLLCFYMRKNNKLVVLSGSLLYSFSSYSISCMTGHVFFLSSTVYLPLIILGVEKIINNDKPHLLSVSVMLSALSNIYFFYMNVLTTVIFVIVRLITTKLDFKERINIFINITIYSALGVLMGAIVFLPMFNTLINNSRLDAGVTYNSLYSIDEYVRMLKNMTFDVDYYGGYSVFWIIAFSSLLFKRRNITLMILLLLVAIFMIVPSMSAIYNAMTYPTNRWGYVAALLIFYIIVDALDDNTTINDCFAFNCILVALFYIFCVCVDVVNWQIHVLFAILSVFVLLVIKYFKNKRTQSLACLFVTLFSLFFQMYYTFGPRYWYLASQGKDISELQNIGNSEHSVFDQLNDESFYRYSGDNLTENESLEGHHSTTQFYWTIANDNVVEFRKQLGYSDNSIHHYDNYEGRFIQNALSSVKYFIEDNEKDIPYGFEYYERINGFNIYSSIYNMPLIYVYDNYLTLEEWNRLNPVEKNGVLVQAATINDNASGLKQKPIRFDNIEIPYTISHNNEIQIDNNTIIITGSNPEVSLTCNSAATGEYYVVVEGLYSNKATAYIRVKYDEIDKYFIFKGTDNPHYTDRHDYIVNLGYLEGIDGEISLDFSDGGTYEYQSIEVVCQPLEHQIEHLEKLKDIEINNLDVEKNNVKADISTKENKIVCFSIPYSKGWKAFVDGKKVELLNCNIQYMGIELEKGNHTIELKYSTPLLKEGAIISFVSSVLLIYLIIKNNKSNKW